MYERMVKCEFCKAEMRERDAREWPAAFPGRRRVFVCARCDTRSEHQISYRNTMRSKQLRKGKEWSK